MVATAQERQVSPIPPGRYWIMVLGGNIPEFDSWLADMAGAVVVESSSLDQDARPPAQFIIFHVPPGRSPFLNAIQFGFPNTAPPGVRFVQDVEQVPEPEGLLPDFKLPDFGQALPWLIVFALLASQGGSLFGSAPRARARRYA